ncbi:uncharacterized protein LOC136081092 [Hydra vulgaris]|uniref:Uncharacterized protein LOC136081092 n=1 Tax=Hydra vulgaris TaxID=6087 RepID=A0ABM4BYY8_HYDVU
MEILKTKNIFTKIIIKISIIFGLLMFSYIVYGPIFRNKKIKDFFQNFKRKHYLDFDTNNQSESKSNVLSYSLFGNNWDKYGMNVESVAKEAANSSFYKSWTVRIYHDATSITPSIAATLTERYRNLEFFNVSNFANLEIINGMVWRFLVVADLNVDVACIRDLDSKLLVRETDAVKDWLKSGKLVHSMRDNPQHGIPMLGGMWCFRNELKRELGIKIAKLCIEKCMHRDPIKHLEANKGDDQYVLNSFVWPLLSQNVLIHDAYLCQSIAGSKPFPSKRDISGVFVGQPRGEPGGFIKCPIECRPKEHQDWEYC